MKLAATIAYRLRRLWEERLAQDLIEYALMAGFVAVSAGAIMPGVATTISSIFSKVLASLGDAGRFPAG